MEAATFRSHFPEFASETLYPPTVVTFWSGIAEKLVIEERWDDLYDHGVELATAHYLSLAAGDQRQAAAGGIPGNSTQGAITSQAVGGVSVSFDSSSALETDAGHWNATTYGRQFIRLARMIGMGGYQL